jgi:hypothetical protein
MQVACGEITALSPTTRSKITNGSRLLYGIDGRSAAARRYRDLISDLIREHGGAKAMSTVDLGLIRQAAAITLQAELLQARIVRGEVVSADELIRLSSEARRILSSLRKRVPPVRPPTLAEYLTARAVVAEGAEEEPGPGEAT